MRPPAERAPRGRPRKLLRRGIPLLPTLFTTGNVLLGFYAVITGLNGDFQRAALLVFIAGVLDGLDGRIARMTGTETDFGKEFDSLADVITFGFAPALLTYLWGVKDLARDAWLVPLFYVVCVALRLARFNVQVKPLDSRFFVGLPAPAGAGAICSLLFFAPDPSWREWMAALMAASLLLVSVLMISTFRYRSFKKFDLTRRWSYRAAAFLAVIVLVIFRNPQATFLVIALLYTASGPLAFLWSRLRHLRRPPPAELPPPAVEALLPPPASSAAPRHPPDDSKA